MGVHASAESVPCRNGGLELRGVSAEQLFEQAEYVAYVTVSDFTEFVTEDDFDGEYTISPLLVFKGEEHHSQVVLGAAPYNTPPQFSFDITKTHSEMDYERLYGGTTGFIEKERVCTLNPKLVVGWNYLVFLGVHSEMAFEPIHSSHLDGWYQEIRRIGNTESIVID
ncbi:MAG: hypothetical protein ABNH53_01340 [Henriciella sp.]